MNSTEIEKLLKKFKRSVDDFLARNEIYGVKLEAIGKKENPREHENKVDMIVYTFLSEYIELFNNALNLLEKKLDDAEYNYLKESINKFRRDQRYIKELKHLTKRFLEEI